MTQVHSLGHGPLKAVNAVYIDEQPIFGHIGVDLAEQWITADRNSFSNVQCGIRRGNYQNQTWPLMVQNGDGEWTNDMKGHSIASLQFLVERPDTRGAKDQEYRVMGTQFQSSALVEGVPVIDPTLDPMLLGISDPSKRVWMNGSKEVYRNPVYQLLTYLCDPMYGVGLKPSMINLQTFINSAQWSEREGMKGDGYINQNDTYQKIIEGFASSWGGNIYLEDGKICCAPETVSPVVEIINENDLIGSMTVTNDRGGYANLIKVEWQDKDTQYNKNTFIIPSDIQTDPTIQEDGKVFERSVEIPMSTDIEYIKRYANRELKRERLCRKEAVFTLNNLDKTLRLNDVFVINNELYGLDADTKWRVSKIEQSLDDKVIQSKITAIQYDSRVYDTSDYMDSNVGGDLGRPSINILPVADLRFVQNNTTDIGSGMLSFESQYYGGEQTFRIQYKLSASSEWIQYGEFPFSNVMITGLQSGTNYDFKVQCAATIGSSKWSELKNQRVNKNISLPAVKNLSGNFTSANAVWTWDAINEPIVNNSVVANTYNNLSELVHYYEVAILHGVTTKKTYRTTTPNFNYLFDENSKNGLSRDVTARVTAISIYGDRGQTTSLKLFNEPMGPPSSVEVKSLLVDLTVSWLNPSDLVSDYGSTDIWITDDKNSPTNDDLVGSTSAGFWTDMRPNGKINCFVWIAHRDVFGHPAIPVYSAPIYFQENSIDDLLTDSEFEGNFKELEDNVNKIDGELTELGKEVDSNKAEVNADLVNQQNQINAEKDRLNGTISDLAETEADLNVAKAIILKNATDIKTNKTEITSQGARLTIVEQVASDNTGSIASVSQRVEAVNKDLNAKVETNKQSIVTTNAALASMDTRLSADIGKNTASITQTNKTVATLNSTVSSMDTRLTAAVNKNIADIKTTQETVADLNGSMSTINTELSAKIDKNTSTIQANKTAIAATDKNLAEYKLTISTEFGKTNGLIDTVSSSVSTLEKTVATQGSTIQANYNDLNGKITTNSTAIVNANKAITSLDTKLTAQIKGVDDKANGIKATVDQQAIAIAATDKSLTELKTSTTAQFGTVNSRIDTVQTNLATTDKALASLDTKLQAQINTNKAGIASNKTAIATTDSALSSYKTSNNAEVAGVKASVTTISQAQASTDGKVSAMYGLKVDANGKVAGMTLAATPKGSTVDFLADVFRIAQSTTGTPQTVFEIRGGNTYIKKAYIGQITASQIEAGAISGDKINASSYVQVGSGNQTCIMNGSDPLHRLWAGHSVSSQAPFRVETTGRVVMANAHVRGHIEAVSGSFSGAISASSGAISGRLTMNGGYIDGRSGQDSINLGSGSFRVDNSGNLFANGGSFAGTIFADKIVGDITNMGVINYPVVNSNAPEGYIESGQQKVLFRMNLSPVNFTRMINISAIPFTWSALENGGYFYIYLRDSTGRSTTLFESGVGSGIFNPYDFSNFIVELPANASWWQIVLTGNRKSRIHRNSTAKAFWSSFKKGSGDVSLSHF
ncbi:phage tail tip fiber protein [Aeromonas salmonicida]